MALWFEDLPMSDWLDGVRTSPDPRADAEALFEAWIRERLDAHPDAAGGGVEWDRRVGRLFLEIDAELGYRAELEHDASSERAIRRWCWAPEWVLMSQDEDLLVMGPRFDPWLLDEAARGCPKRDYVAGIVAHSLRDSLHHALWPRHPDLTRERFGVPRTPEVRAAIDAVLQRAEAVASASAGVGAPALADYAARIAGYRRAGRVDREQARQRVLDCRRCSPQEHVPVELSLTAGQWVAPLAQANLFDGRLHVHAKTGEMWGVNVATRA